MTYTHFGNVGGHAKPGQAGAGGPTQIVQPPRRQLEQVVRVPLAQFDQHQRVQNWLGPTVTADRRVTVGRIDFDNANAYTIAGSNPLTLNAASGEAQISVTSGSHTISAPVLLAVDTVITVSPADSNLSITGTLGAGAANLTKAGAGSLTLNNLRARGLTINDGTVVLNKTAGTIAYASMTNYITNAHVPSLLEVNLSTGARTPSAAAPLIYGDMPSSM
jgi:hypothetical protein